MKLNSSIQYSVSQQEPPAGGLAVLAVGRKGAETYRELGSPFPACHGGLHNIIARALRVPSIISQIVLQLSTAPRMTQATEGLTLDLANALAGQSESLTDFL